MNDLPFEMRVANGLFCSLLIGLIVAVGIWFYARRRDMTQAKRDATAEEIKNERNPSRPTRVVKFVIIAFLVVPVAVALVIVAVLLGGPT